MTEARRVEIGVSIYPSGGDAVITEDGDGDYALMDWDDYELLSGRNRYETGYADGESSITADIERHLNENCGMPDGDERTWAEYTSWLWSQFVEAKHRLRIIEHPAGILEMQKMLDDANERIEDLEGAIRQAIEWFERPDAPPFEKYAIWQDAADWLREHGLKEVDGE